MEGFEYVVNPPVMPKVVFGSGMERVCLPMEGPQLSSFMRRNQGEVRNYPGPFEYTHELGLLKKMASKYGHSPFVNKAPRLPPSRKPDVPPLGIYEPEPPKYFKQTIGSFGGFAPRDVYFINDVPGPATYPFHEPFPKQKRIMAFNTYCFRWPAVYMFCTPRNKAICHRCKKVPVGDYFHNFTKKLDMCRKCMKYEIKQVKGCDIDFLVRQRTYNELKQFKPARYCGFFHNHNGTTAAVQLISRKQLHKKIVVENYLYQFVK